MRKAYLVWCGYAVGFFHTKEVANKVCQALEQLGHSNSEVHEVVIWEGFDEWRTTWPATF